MNELIEQLNSMASSDPNFYKGVNFLMDNMDNLSIDEQRNTILLIERLIKGDNAMEKEMKK